MKGTTNQEAFLTFSPDKCSVTKYLGMDYEDNPGILPVKMYTDLDRCLEQNAAPDDPDILSKEDEEDILKAETMGLDRRRE
jgi:hypothetical protein